MKKNTATLLRLVLLLLIVITAILIFSTKPLNEGEEPALPVSGEAVSGEAGEIREGSDVVLPETADSKQYTESQKKAVESALAYVKEMDEYMEYKGKNLTVTSIAQGKEPGSWTVKLEFKFESRRGRIKITLNIKDGEVIKKLLAKMLDARCDSSGNNKPEKD